MKKSFQERFESKFSRRSSCDCWHWTGSLGHNGYGLIRKEGKTLRSHRVSYELYIGSIPKGMFVLHKCDMRNCVNPDHLFLGSQQENITDMIKKGRGNKATGESSGHAKLSESDIPKIRNDTRTLRAIAADYGVSFPLIGYIKNRKIWTHI